MPLFIGAPGRRRNTASNLPTDDASGRNADPGQVRGRPPPGTAMVRLTSGRRVPRDGHRLMARWQAASLERGWRVTSDWHAPSVDGLVAALVAKPYGAVGEEYFEGLGKDRAEIGTGLTEALEDLAALADALGVESLDPHVAVALARGWSEASSYAPAEPALDALTGLGTPSYLHLRLREVYEEAEYRGVAPGRRWALVVVDFGDVRRDELGDSEALIEVARSLRLLYSSGQTVVRLGPARFAVLTRQSGLVIEQAEILADLVQERLERIGRGSGWGVRSPLEWHAIDLPASLSVARETVDRLTG